MKKLIFLIISFCILIPCLEAQSLTYSYFIQQVKNQNPEYLAAQLSNAQAQAELSVAKKINNPVLSAEYGNNSDKSMLMGQSGSMELSQTLSFGRHSRIQSASFAAQAAQSGMLYQQQGIVADATKEFLNALMLRDQCSIMKETVENMKKLYSADSIRKEKGDISPLDLMQTRIESGLARQDFRTKEAELNNALTLLDLLMNSHNQKTQHVVGELLKVENLYHLDTILPQALLHRMDLDEAMNLVKSSQSELKNIRMQRIPEMDIALGANYNARVRNEEAPAPEFWGYTVGVSIPLPLSNINRGEVKMGEFKVQEAQLLSQSIEAQIRMEVTSAFNTYQMAKEKVKEFDASFIQDAQQVLDGKMYAYFRGESSLLEVIDAQRTYNEIRLAYVESLYDLQCALVDLEFSMGIWNYEL